MGGCSSYSSRDYDWSEDSKVTKKSASEYATEDKRTYTGSTSGGIAAPRGRKIETLSDLALVLVLDVTGSMKKWPGQILQKIPPLYEETNAVLQGAKLEDLKKGYKPEHRLEMCVFGVGDAKCDQYPIQVSEFAKSADLTTQVNRIFPEGGGGPFGCESYELPAYYLLNHCSTPNVPKGSKPILIFACDEDFYSRVRLEQVNGLFGDNIPADLDSDNVMRELAKRFDTYVLRPEPQGPCGVYERAQQHWQDVLGDQRVLKMSSPDRIVDCINMICAYAADNYAEGEAMLRRRQGDDPAKVRQVIESLHPLVGER